MKQTDPALRWLCRVIGRHQAGIALLLLIQMVLGGSSVLFALILRQVIDTAAAGQADGFRTSLLLLTAIVIGQIALRAVTRYLEERTRSGIENKCKKRLFSALLEKEYAAVTAVHSGEWLNRLTSDTAVCAAGAVEILPGAGGMLVKLTGALVMLLWLEPRFAMLLLPGGAALLLLTYVFRRVLKKLHKQVQTKDGQVRIYLQERLTHLLIVRAFSAEALSRSEAAEKMEAHKAARMQRNHFSNFCNTGFAAAMNAMYLIGLGYCGAGIVQGTISYGTLMAMLQLIGQIQAPFANITGILPKYYAMTASAERLAEAERFADDCPGGAKTAETVRQFYTQSFAAIGISAASFAYPQNAAPVLEHIDLTIRKGEFCALAGHSGCGKSTLLRLLLCLYPLNSGERFLLQQDGTTLALTSEWHRLFAYVPQGSQLMSGSIREAVTFASPVRDEEKLWQALHIACADTFVRALPEGLDYVLSEHGQGLSEGQLQRIAVARAIYSDDPILLLDEATSALDEANERQLLQNLRSMTDRTVLIVTHRPAALKVCDTIIQMDENGIRKEETHETDRL